MIALICLIIAAICFAAAAFGDLISIGLPINLVAAGLFFWVLAVIIGDAWPKRSPNG